MSQFALSCKLSRVFLLLCCCAVLSYAAVISLFERTLLVDGHPFFCRGVNYPICVQSRQERLPNIIVNTQSKNPVPISLDPNKKNDYYSDSDRDIWQRDLPLIRDLNANMIRMYGWTNYWDHSDFLDSLYNDGISPIYVALTFWFPKQDLSDSLTRVNLKAQFRQMVVKYKSHPAVLMWMIGNEMNSVAWYGSTKAELDNALSLVDEMAQLAHAEDPTHPVALPLDATNIEAVIAKYDSQLTHLDIWAVQLYRGRDFGDFFSAYPGLSNRPLFMSEFGLDAFDDRVQLENATMQAEYNTLLWDNVMLNKKYSIGGAVFSFTDEWWKGREGQYDDRHQDCPSSDPSVHSNCGMPITGPDSYSNEEWYGLFSVTPNTPEPDVLTARPAFYALQAQYAILKAGDSKSNVIGSIIALGLASVLLLSTVSVFIYRHFTKKWRKQSEMQSLSMRASYPDVTYHSVDMGLQH